MQKGIAGTLQSNDCMVTLELADTDLAIEIESPVKQEFGDQIESVAKKALTAHGVQKGTLKIEDRGALDCTIRARIETAVRRATQEDDAPVANARGGHHEK